MNYYQGNDAASIGAITGSIAIQESPIHGRISQMQRAGEALLGLLELLEGRLSSIAPMPPQSPMNGPMDKEPGPSCDLEGRLFEVESQIRGAHMRVDSLIYRLKL